MRADPVADFPAAREDDTTRWVDGMRVHRWQRVQVPAMTRSTVFDKSLRAANALWWTGQAASLVCGILTAMHFGPLIFIPTTFVIGVLVDIRHTTMMTNIKEEE